MVCPILSICVPVTSWCSTEMAKQDHVNNTTRQPRDSFLTPKISAKFKRGRPQWRYQMQVGYVKCRCSRCTLATFDVKCCQLSSVASLSQSASTLFVCGTFAVIQHIMRVGKRQLIFLFGNNDSIDSSTVPLPTVCNRH